VRRSIVRHGSFECVGGPTYDDVVSTIVSTDTSKGHQFGATQTIRPIALVETKSKYALSRGTVLSIYWLIPICMAALGLDQLIGTPLKRWLPTSPENWMLFTLFFGTPHIVASSLLLVGIKEYRRHYFRRLLIWALCILAALFGLNALVSYDVLYALIAGWTVKHVLGQQFGIGNSVARCKGWTYKLWQSAAFIAGTAAYLIMHLGSSWTQESMQYARILIGAMLLVVVALGLRLDGVCESKTGRTWIRANTALVITSVATLLLGYPFFAVLIPRVIHDTTAFMVYGVHERNRGSMTPDRPSWRLPVVGLALTVIVSLVVQRFLDGPLVSLGHRFGLQLVYPVSLYFAGFLALIHYCSEAVTWRSGSPYRARFAMSA
jgi:hypothetical protein